MFFLVDASALVNSKPIETISNLTVENRDSLPLFWAGNSSTLSGSKENFIVTSPLDKIDRIESLLTGIEHGSVFVLGDVYSQSWGGESPYSHDQTVGSTIQQIYGKDGVGTPLKIGELFSYEPFSLRVVSQKNSGREYKQQAWVDIDQISSTRYAFDLVYSPDSGATGTTVSQEIFGHIGTIKPNSHEKHESAQTSMVGNGVSFFIGEVGERSKQTSVTQYIESIGKIGILEGSSADWRTPLTLRGIAFSPTLVGWKFAPNENSKTPFVTQHIGRVGQINSIEVGVLYGEGRGLGTQVISSVDEINIIGAGMSNTTFDNVGKDITLLNHSFGVYNWSTSGYTVKDPRHSVGQQILINNHIKVKAALGSETWIGNSGLSWSEALREKSANDVIWGNFSKYEKPELSLQPGDEKKSIAAAVYNRGGLQEIWSTASAGVEISAEEDRSLVPENFQDRIKEGEFYGVYIAPEFRRESRVWTSGNSATQISWDSIKKYDLNDDWSAYQDLTTRTELSGNFRFTHGDLVVKPHQQFQNMVNLSSYKDRNLRSDVILQFTAAREAVPVYLNPGDPLPNQLSHYEKGVLKTDEKGNYLNHSWLADNVDIKIFPAIGNYEENGKIENNPRGYELSKHYFFLGDSQQEDDPGYNIHLGKSSEINVKGTYPGNGTVWFGTSIDKKNLTVEAEDPNGNRVFGLNGAIKVNANPVVIDDVVKGSQLNLVVNLSANNSGVTSQELKNYFKYDAAGRAGKLLQQAANNIFIGQFVEKAQGPGTLNTHAGLEISDKDFSEFKKALEETGNSQQIQFTEGEKTFADGMKNEDVTVKYVWELNRLNQWVQVPITESKVTDVSGKMVAGKVSLKIDETLLEPAETFSTIYYIENSEWVANPNDIRDSIAIGDRERNETSSEQTQALREARLELSEEEKTTKEDRMAHQSNLGEGTIFSRPEEPDPTPIIVERPDDSSSTVKALNSASIINYFLWRQENETLYQRMGEVRDNANLEGLWVRGLAGKNIYDKNKYYYRNRYHGIQMGLDRLVKREKGNSWLLGIGFTYTKGDSRLSNNGKDDNWIGTISAYATRHWNTGGYVDFIVKGSRLNNDFTAISDLLSTGDRFISRGKFHTYGFQISGEAGKKFLFGKGWYVDPELQLTYGHIREAKYHTDSGIDARIKSSNSLIGRVGLGIGKEGKSGSAFIKVDGLKEFVNQFNANYKSNDGGTASSVISMKDTWGEVTLGGTYNFKKNVYGFAQAKRSFAADIKQAYRLDAGLRIIF